MTEQKPDERAVPYVTEDAINPRVLTAMGTLGGALMDQMKPDEALFFVGRLSDDAETISSVAIRMVEEGTPEKMVLAARAYAQRFVNEGGSVILAGAATTFIQVQPAEGEERKVLQGTIVLMEDRNRRYAEGYVEADGERYRISQANLKPDLVESTFGNLIGRLVWPVVF